MLLNDLHARLITWYRADKSSRRYEEQNNVLRTFKPRSCQKYKKETLQQVSYAGNNHKKSLIICVYI